MDAHERVGVPGWRALVFGIAVACADARERPNVVLVVVDTLRADRLGCYGYERDTSPHLDRLAAEGVRYLRAMSQAPWTTPSIGSLLTSRYPSEIGIERDTSALANELLLLPEVLAEHDYATAAVVSHSYCSSQYNFDQGFERFDERNIRGHDAITSPDVTSTALEIVDSITARPFFLWVHYFDPHFAYIGHGEFRFEGPRDYEGRVEDGMQYATLFKQRYQLSVDDLEQLRALYDSEVAWTDHWIGALFDGLRGRGLWDDSLVILTADHGEEFRDHGDLGHSRTLYQELIHAPLLIKHPSAAAYASRGTIREESVALLDIFPTVLDAAGIPAPAGLAGVSLLGTARRALPLVSETARKGGVRCIVDGRYKLIQHAETDSVELYDLVADPHEARDLSEALPERANSMRAELLEWARTIQRLQAPEIDIAPGERARLEQLGYTE